MSNSIDFLILKKDVLANLEGLDKNNRLKIWNCNILSSDDQMYIEIEYGYKDCKIQNTRRLVNSNNIEKAYNDAKSLIIKKIEEGYNVVGECTNLEKRSRPTQFNVPLPMLAMDFDKYRDKINYPCFVQPKMDGVRAILVPKEGIFSRKRKRLIGFKNLVNEYQHEYTLDGELWSPDLKFEQIVSLVRDETLIDKNISFIVFDIILPNTKFVDRLELLKNLNLPTCFQKCTTWVVDDEKQIEMYKDNLVKKGYEGIIIRNAGALYENFRSSNLLKYKDFNQDEFEITGYKEGEGNDLGCVVWECKSSGGNFWCVYGNKNTRKIHLKYADSFIGQNLIVKYQGFTKNNIPRFPKGIEIRNYE